MVSSDGLEQVPCALGHKEPPVTVLTGRDLLHGLPGEFTVVKCPVCRLMWTNPRPRPEAIGAYYPEEYAPYNIETPVTVHPGKSIWAKLGIENANRTPELQPGRLFEIGCSSGRYLLTMKQKGWEVSGLEFSPQVAARAREKGLNVVAGTAEFLSTEEKDKYNLIAAWMVIEHLHDPVTALRALRNKVSDDGYLVCSVPDAAALEFRLFRGSWFALQLPSHLYHFTSATLEQTLAASGWRVERIFWHSNPNNLLMSLHYVFRSRGWNGLAGLAKAVAQGGKWPRVRLALGILLGILRQSGRITVWARPQ